MVEIRDDALDQARLGGNSEKAKALALIYIGDQIAQLQIRTDTLLGAIRDELAAIRDEVANSRWRGR